MKLLYMLILFFAIIGLTAAGPPAKKNGPCQGNCYNCCESYKVCNQNCARWHDGAFCRGICQDKYCHGDWSWCKYVCHVDWCPSDRTRLLSNSEVSQVFNTVKTCKNVKAARSEASQSPQIFPLGQSSDACRIDRVCNRCCSKMDQCVFQCELQNSEADGQILCKNQYCTGDNKADCKDRCEVSYCKDVGGLTEEDIPNDPNSKDVTNISDEADNLPEDVCDIAEDGRALFRYPEFLCGEDYTENYEEDDAEDTEENDEQNPDENDDGS